LASLATRGAAAFGFVIAATLALATNAHAGAVPGGLAYSYFGIGEGAQYVVTSTNFGVLDYTGGSNCSGICTATTSLAGANGPSVDVKVSDVVTGDIGGGYVGAELYYYFEFVAAPGTYNAVVNAADMLNVVDGGTAQAYLGLGPAGTPPASLSTINQNLFTYSPTFQETDCANGCGTGIANYTSPAPLGASPTTIQANVVYAVEMWVTLDPESDGIPMEAYLDPTITVDGSGTLVYSDGVSFDTPEPATASVLLAGLTGVGLARRRRGKPTARA
jgi:hypothetical protein